MAKNGSSNSAITTLRQQLQYLYELSKTARGRTRNLVFVIVAEAHPREVAVQEIEAQGLSPGPVSEAISDWVTRGYLRVNVHPADSRQQVVSLTTKGERAARALLGFASH